MIFSTILGRLTAHSPELMNSDDWQRILGLFYRMLEATEPECVRESEPDPLVRAEAQRLFEHHHQAESGFLRSPFESLRTAGARPRFTPGTLLAGRFRIQRLTGTGGMGEVYEAEDTLLGERVALKTIRAGCDWDPEFASRLLQEAQSARRVTHCNVCRIHECFRESSSFFLSMELIDGVTLNTLIAPGAPGLTAAERADVALQAGHAVAAIHGRGLVHGDLKPANILIERPAGGPLRAVVTDFGLAALLSAPARRPLAGTAGFVAPELLAGGAPSIASDLYAFGRILTLLTPADPFAGLCMRDDPSARPASIHSWPRLRHRSPWRRTFLWSAATALAAASPLAYVALRRRPLRLTTRERALLNALRGDLGPRLQPYVEYCIRQSALVGLVPSPGRTALALPPLFAAARARNARIALTGEAIGRDGAVRLRLSAYEVSGEREAAVVELSGPLGAPLARLASQAVRQLRLALGEAQALVAANGDLDRTASPSSQAVILYFDAIQRYESGEPSDALRLFEEALHYDKDFPLAHFGRSRALSSLSREPEALDACTRAMAGRARLARPQQLAVEALFAVLVNRLDEAAGLYRRLLLVEPEQAPWHRQYANVLGLSGRVEDALDSARNALELDPASQMNWSALALLQAEAGQPANALATVTQARAGGFDHPTLLWSEAEAQALVGRATDALETLCRMARQGPYERLARDQASLLRIWLGRLRDAAVDLETDIPRDELEAHSRWAWERRLRLAQIATDLGDRPRARYWLEQLPEPAGTPLYVPLYRAAGVLAARMDAPSLAQALRVQLEAIQQRWPSPQTEAALCHLRAAQTLADPAANLLTARTELARGFGLLPDPAMTLDFARVLHANHEIEPALHLLESYDRFLGALLQRGYPGLVVHTWLERARLLQLLNQPAEARLLYGKLLNQWPPTSGAVAAQSARRAMAAL